ncbi:MAG: DUF3592 domain-containing protein [Anaerolineae bacterium]|nr:DUF3592 domain-containing protein [Anaerolineae bacterium]MBL6965024.1 DUF3592 domain-containing protein [Anaerolineales bacterium]
MNFINCPWCGQRVPQTDLDCRKCGGPLTPPVGNDPGAAPPPPPRTLPAGYKRRMLFKNAPFTLIGGIFLIIGFPIGLIFTILGFVIPGMWLFIVIGGGVGGIFTLLGGGMLYAGVQQGLDKIRPYEHGQATVGEVIEIQQDYSMSVNGRYPWAIVYIFDDARGRPYEGKAITWQHAPKTQAVGNRVYVLYLPDDPDQNALYPPA